MKTTTRMQSWMAVAARGFSLVEVVIAIGVVAFALLAVLGLLPVALGTNRDATLETEAANIAALLESDIRSTSRQFNPDGSRKSSTDGSPIYGIPFDGRNASEVELFLDEGGSRNDASGTAYTGRTGKYRITVRFSPASGRNAIPLVILVTWPAQLNAADASGRFEMMTSLDRN
jgi:uncharacterized protein (TIGR02598 family)